MKAAGVTSIVLELRFGSDYPYSPPFVRVVRPRFLPFLEGGGGHVTAGGAMCMELLTSSGWTPANSMESVFLQVRVALCSLDPKPARLAMGGKTRRSAVQDYGVGEALDAFVRAASAHGWGVPSGLAATVHGV
jgi:ubiquitin-conjugating enzyme E2 Q